MNTPNHSNKSPESYINPTVEKNREILEKQKVSTICEKCPISLWFTTNQNTVIKCYCPKMNSLTLDETTTQNEAINQCSEQELQLLKLLQEQIEQQEKEEN